MTLLNFLKPHYTFVVDYHDDTRYSVPKKDALFSVHSPRKKVLQQNTLLLEGLLTDKEAAHLLNLSKRGKIHDSQWHFKKCHNKILLFLSYNAVAG